MENLIFKIFIVDFVVTWKLIRSRDVNTGLVRGRFVVKVVRSMGRVYRIWLLVRFGIRELRLKETVILVIRI